MAGPSVQGAWWGAGVSALRALSMWPAILGGTGPRGWPQRHGLNVSVPHLPVILGAVVVSGSRACSSMHPGPQASQSSAFHSTPQEFSHSLFLGAITSVFQAGPWSPRVQGWGQGGTGTGMESREGQGRPGDLCVPHVPVNKSGSRDFPGGPVVMSFHCRRPGFNPWSHN